MSDRRASIDERLGRFDRAGRQGRLEAVIGTAIRARVPDVRIGDVCDIETGHGRAVQAEVVGFDAHGVLLMPLGNLEGTPIRATVRPEPVPPDVPAGSAVLGRVLDAFGCPIDGAGPLTTSRAPLHRSPPAPLSRERIRTPLVTGVRAIDGLLTFGRGQRVGIFAGAGVGKSTLLSALARNVEADVVVLALIGERGREVASFIEDDLGDEGMRSSVVVVSTADEPALRRLRAAYTATAIAEAFREEGRSVVLLMDSVTRFARALREIGLAAGEPVGRQGYPASVFAALPRLFERAGNDARGSITAMYTVLVTGDDLSEPIADETMSLLDGHVILSRTLAARGHYPAIDVLRSKSRVMQEVTTSEHRADASWASRVVATYEANEPKISLGVYTPATEEDRVLISQVGGQVVPPSGPAPERALPVDARCPRCHSCRGRGRVVTGGFGFSLAPLLTVAIEERDRRARDLADASAALDEARRALQEARDQREQSRQRCASAHDDVSGRTSLMGGEAIRRVALRLEALDLALARAQESVDSHEAHVEQVRSRHGDALDALEASDVRVRELERLRDDERRRWDAARARREELERDDAAMIAWNANRRSSP